MDARTIRYVSMAALLSMLALLPALHGLQQGPSVAEASNACFSTHNSGAGATLMNICISAHGNLVKFESPAGFQQIGQLNTFRDGYSICTGNLPAFPNVSHGFDAGGQESGFGLPIITQPNGANTFPLTIVRTTASGVYQLTQSFIRDTAHKNVIITMTVRRLSLADCGASGCPPVRLVRYFEGDVDNNTSTGARFARTQDAVWEWVEQFDANGSPIRHGLMLQNRSSGVSVATVVDTVGDHNASKKQGCIVFAGQVPTPTDPAVTNAANLVGYMYYFLTLNSVGSQATRVVVYRRL